MKSSDIELMLVPILCFSGIILTVALSIRFFMTKRFRLGLTTFLLVVAFWFLICVPMFCNGVQEAVRRSDCYNNIKQIILFMKIYAESHSQNYPSSFNALAGIAAVSSNDTCCFVHSKRKHQQESLTNIEDWTDYAYVSGLKDTDPDGCVVVFCLPEHHGDNGANVGFMSGKTQWFFCKAHKELPGEQHVPTFQELTNTPSLFFGTTDEVQLADLKKRTRIIWPHQGKR